MVLFIDKKGNIFCVFSPPFVLLLLHITCYNVIYEIETIPGVLIKLKVITSCTDRAFNWTAGSWYFVIPSLSPCTEHDSLYQLLMAFSQRSWRVWEIGNEEENKGREELEDSRRETETERNLAVAVLQLGSREIFHALRDLLLSFTHLWKKYLPSPYSYPIFSWPQTEFLKREPQTFCAQGLVYDVTDFPFSERKKIVPAPNRNLIWEREGNGNI